MSKVSCLTCGGELKLEETKATCVKCFRVHTAEDFPTNPDWSEDAAKAVNETGWILIGMIVFVVAVILFV